MLAGIAIARPAPYVAQIVAATAVHASGLRDEITTFAPASAMRSAIALPMPRVEPVITAVLPASENNDMAGSLVAIQALVRAASIYGGSSPRIPCTSGRGTRSGVDARQDASRLC